MFEAVSRTFLVWIFQVGKWSNNWFIFYYFTKLVIGTYSQEIWIKINVYPNGNVKVEKIIIRKVDYWDRALTVETNKLIILGSVFIWA